MRVSINAIILMLILLLQQLISEAQSSLLSEKINDTIKEIILVEKTSGISVKQTPDPFQDYGIWTHPLDFRKGRLSSFNISSVSGEPGSDIQYYKNGINSIFGQTNATIIFNDLLIDERLKYINYHDIESIFPTSYENETPIFNFLTSNGLIISNSKTGKDKIKVLCSIKSGISWLPKQADILSGDQTRALLAKEFSDFPEILNLAGSFSTDWQKEITRSPVSKDFFLGISDTLRSIPFHLSFGNTGLEGIIRNSDYGKNTFSVSISPKFIKSRLSIDFLNYYTKINSNKVTESAYLNALGFSSTYPVYEQNEFGGYYTPVDEDGKPLYYHQNPLALIEMNHGKENSVFASTSLNVQYSFNKIKGLRIGINSSFQFLKENTTFTSDSKAAWSEYDMYSFQSNNNLRLLQIHPNLNFKHHIIKNKILINLTTGYLLFRNNSETNHNQNELPWSYSYKIKKSSLYSDLSIYVLQKYKLNINLTQATDRNFILRSSTLLPSIITSWNIGKESIFKRNSTFSSLVVWLKCGYNSHLPHSSVDYHSFNPDLKPSLQRSIQSGLNIDLGISTFLSMNYYSTLNTDEYFYSPANSSSIFILSNLLTIRNRGVNIMLNSLFGKKSKVQTHLGFFINYNQNKLIDFTGINGIEIVVQKNRELYSPALMLKPSLSTFTFLLKKQIYDVDGKPVEGAYEINQNTSGYDVWHYFSKSALPDFIAGLNAAITINKFETLFEGRLCIGNYVYNGINARSFVNNIVDSEYSLSNISTSFEQSGFQNHQDESDYYLENASFFKMDLIGLGYSFDNIRNKGYNLKFTASLQNAFTITNYSGIDPEVASGEDTGAYPRARTLSLGVIFEY